MLPRLGRDSLLLISPLVAYCLVCAPTASAVDRPFEIQVIDDATGRGVPLVELRTVNEIRLVTDSAGRVAFDEPGLMGRSVYFHVASHGYTHPTDGFGNRGKAVDVVPGGRAELRLERLNVAERLYRLTGQGIYRDTTLLGHEAPIREPNLNGLVLGQDSVLNAVFRGRLYWFWGDTNRPGYPLGNFHTPGAVSDLPGKGGLDPDFGVNLSYYVDENGFAKPTCKMPGDGPTWVSGLVVLGPAGQERMLASYAKIKPPMETYERGFVAWDDDAAEFRELCTFPVDAPIRPEGHPLYVRGGDRSGEPDRVYFAQPLPLVRVEAAPEAFLDLDRYEAYTCLKPGSRAGKLEVERDGSGRPVYGWKRNTPPTGPGEQAELLKAGLLKEEEQLHALRDIETGKPVQAHGGSVWRLPSTAGQVGRYALLFVEVLGTPSFLGEVWYAEADSPIGPWVYARKVVTHDRYSFYNPKIHDEFSDRRHLYFEGTYTTTFSGNPLPTPRYEYNQVMYRLDRDDPRLFLPVAVRSRVVESPAMFPDGGRIAFFAPDRPAPGCLPVYRDGGLQGGLTLAAPPQSGPRSGEPLFYALTVNVDPPPPGTVLLYEHTNSSGKKVYVIEGQSPRAELRRADAPFCRVWSAPVTRAADAGLAPGG